MNTLDQIKEQICDVCHKMWQLGWVAANDGNVSARLPDGRWAVRIVTSCATTEDAIADLSAWFIKKVAAGIVKNYIGK